ncbi:1180_t:CDS:2 [Ambispora leptoticha]|uniref:Histone H1 n=1 Tax=Ambispora leptoticha TaxID=144679 RepID=A0A9N8WQD7_9GLOM|nr:1180_t:CDS:2 [Ambispora leptoticha]
MGRTTQTKSAPKKAAAASTHPKYEDMIKAAIIALKERKGSSRQAIKKWILNTHKLPDNPTTTSRIKLAINKGVEKQLFAFNNGPSGTIKLVKKEPIKKEKKEVEKKEKPKKEKKEVKPKAEKKATATTKKTTPKKAPTKKAAPKKAAPKKTTKTAATKRSATKKTTTSRTKKASEAST